MNKHIVNFNSEALKQDYDNNGDITIDQPNVVWNTSRVIYGDVYIEPEAKLTIRGKVLMSPNSRIIVKRQARLVVEGGHLTTKGPAAVNCDGVQVIDRWQGIEVWGNTNVQATEAMLDEGYTLQPGDPGVVILRIYQGRKAKIENANRGIQTQQNGAYDWYNSKVYHYNGLVSASDAQFINCRKAVEFLSSLGPIDNPSKFERCDFIQNYLPGNAVAYEGVTQWQVKGVRYTNCTFSRLYLGIGSLNGKLLVNKSTFFRCNHTVVEGATGPVLGALSVVGGALSSDKNLFENCVYSVVCNGYNFLQVANNHFKNCAFGVIAEGTSGYQVTDNVFEFTGPGQMNFNSAISLINSGGGFNFAECNQYIANNAAWRLNSGIAALGDNHNFTFRKEDFDCWRDAQVLKAVLANGAEVPGKISDQGTYFNAVRNLFTGVVFNSSTGQYGWQPGHASDILTEQPSPENALHDFNYFYPPNAPVESRLIPKCPKEGFGILPLCGAKFNFVNKEPADDGEMFCGPRVIQDYFNGGPDCRREDCLADFYTTIRRADSLLQLGAAPQLLSLVQTSPNGTATMQSLLAVSPYLSNDVMNAVVENQIMTEANKNTVLGANTPLPVSVLENVAVHLTALMYQQLLAASPQEALSARDSLKAERVAAQRNKSALLAHLTDSLYKAGNYTHIEYLLQNDPDRESREAIVGLKIQLQDYATAQALLNAYPTTTVADDEFRQVQLINLRRTTEGPNFELSATEDTFLHRQALAYGPQTGYARTLLYLLKGELYERVIPVYDDPEERDQPPLEQATDRTPLLPIFTIRPNPAGEQVLVVVTDWQEDVVTVMLVTDLAGRQVFTQTLTSSLTNLNIGNLPSGLYLVRLTRNGKSIATQKLVKY